MLFVWFKVEGFRLKTLSLGCRALGNDLGFGVRGIILRLLSVE